MILVKPRGAKQSQREGWMTTKSLGATTITEVRKRTEQIIAALTTFDLLLFVNGWRLHRRLTDRTEESIGLLLLAIERRSRLQGFLALSRGFLRYCGCERSNGGVGRQDRTEEPVGNQGKASRSDGRADWQSRANWTVRTRVFCYRSNGRVGRLSAATRSNGRSSAVARLRDDRSGRFDGG
jgi:hypothetical protein